MINRYRIKYLLPLAVCALAAPLTAQQSPFSFEVRGGYGVPIGVFGDNAGGDFGFGAGLVLSLTPAIGVYGGWSRDSFGCESLLCDSGSQVRISGFELGAKLRAPTDYRILPWLKAGVIAHKTVYDGPTVEGASTQFESEREYGFQVAAGFDYALGEVLSISPGLRLNSLKNADGFFADPEVRYLSVDLGAHFHLPRN